MGSRAHTTLGMKAARAPEHAGGDGVMSTGGGPGVAGGLSSHADRPPLPLPVPVGYGSRQGVWVES